MSPERMSRRPPGSNGECVMLSVRQDCWPDNDNPSERYLYVNGPGSVDTRIEIMEDNVFADDADIVFGTKAELDEWVRVLRMAWTIKEEQDKKGWRERE